MGNKETNDNVENANYVKGVASLIDLHVYRIAPGTKPEVLEEYLRPNFSEVVCETLESKNAKLYSSFKVKILKENFDKAMDPSIWPQNACVSRFLYRKKRFAEQQK